MGPQPLFREVPQVFPVTSGFLNTPNGSHMEHGQSAPGSGVCPSMLSQAQGFTRLMMKQ